MVLTMVLSVLAGWLLVSVLLALFLGRVIRLADRRAAVVRDSRTARAVRVPVPSAVARV